MEILLKTIVLFGTLTIEELRNKVSQSVPDYSMGYSGSFEFPPSILSSIRLEEIATSN